MDDTRKCKHLFPLWSSIQGVLVMPLRLCDIQHQKCAGYLVLSILEYTGILLIHYGTNRELIDVVCWSGVRRQ